MRLAISKYLIIRQYEDYFWRFRTVQVFLCFLIRNRLSFVIKSQTVTFAKIWYGNLFKWSDKAKFTNAKSTKSRWLWSLLRWIRFTILCSFKASKIHGSYSCSVDLTPRFKKKAQNYSSKSTTRPVSCARSHAWTSVDLHLQRQASGTLS